MAETRFLLCPGNVTSQADGQTHFVSARDLARLWGVPMSMCSIQGVRGGDRYGPDVVRLGPDGSGEYNLLQTLEADPPLVWDDRIDSLRKMTTLEVRRLYAEATQTVLPRTPTQAAASSFVSRPTTSEIDTTGDGSADALWDECFGGSDGDA